MVFSVPTGNFGDAFAGYAATAMGLPAERLVIATNENDILRRAWSTGMYYDCAEVIATTSPSMDIQVSSNFERFLFEAAGRDAAFVRGKMNGLRQSGSIGLGEAIVPYREAFIAERVDQNAVADCIRRVRAESGYLLDPHSACAVVAARKTLTAQTRHIPHIALATAHPAKFPDAMRSHHRRTPGPAAAARAADVGKGTRHGAAQRSRRRPALRRGGSRAHRQGAAA